VSSIPESFRIFGYSSPTFEELATIVEVRFDVPLEFLATNVADLYLQGAVRVVVESEQGWQETEREAAAEEAE